MSQLPLKYMFTDVKVERVRELLEIPEFKAATALSSFIVLAKNRLDEDLSNLLNIFYSAAMKALHGELIVLG